MAFDFPSQAIGYLGTAFLIFNYLALAWVFISRYFEPKKWAVWLVTASEDNYIIFLLSFVLVLVPYMLLKGVPDMLLRGGLCNVCNGLPILLLFAFLASYLVVRKIRKRGDDSILPVALFFLSIGQEAYYAVMNPGSFVVLFVWYGVGIFGVLFFGTWMGKAMARIFPKTEAENLALVRKNFGPGAPQTIRQSDGSMSEINSRDTVATFAVGMVFYAAWMILKYVIFGF